MPSRRAEKTMKPNTNSEADSRQPVNKEAFRMLAHEIGLNAACRKLDIPISTGKSWARRGRWNLTKRPGGRPGRALPASSASSLHPIAKALKDSLEESATETRSSLAQATAAAARNAAAATIPVCSTAHLKDLAATAARVFGWDQQQRAGDTYNTLVVTQEQLAMIRSLRQQTLKQGDVGYVSQPDKEREEGNQHD
jgi:hypothetical protein